MSPHRLRPTLKANCTVAMAGLYELWRDPDKNDDDEYAWLWTMTILTTTATDAAGQIHDRMPMTVDRSQWSDWLDPEVNDLAYAQSLLVPLSQIGLDIYPVSSLVSNVRNNGAHLLDPAPLDDLPAAVSQLTSDGQASLFD